MMSRGAASLVSVLVRVRGARAGAAEPVLIEALDDPCGYVGLYAQSALQHLESPTAEQAVLDLMMVQRWDSSLTAERPW